MTETASDCLFCKIVAHGVPAEIVAETEHCVAFRDINPQAPTHLLVIPRVHQPNIGALAEAEPAVAAALLTDVQAVANAEGVGEGYRLVFNTGEAAQQTVFHCHAHLLAGRSLNWPPG